jgi:uncharacterized protein YndB with AHSA1/START domain
MSTRIQPAPVRRTLVVAADPVTAFEVFTAGIDRWWPRSHTIGKGPLTRCVIEGRAGGRWYGVDEDGTETNWGDVLVWSPPERLVLAWRIAVDWVFDPQLHTEVEVTFTPVAEGTAVHLEHRYLERMGPAAEAARARFDSPNGWSAIIALYAAEASRAAATRSTTP